MDDDFDMQDVVSSQLAAVGYKPETRQMRIRFKSGAVYEYSNVGQETVDSLLSAPSIGQYFNQSVKWNFKYEKVA